jgi:pyridoxal phosphate enzyme (YggS family)
VNEIARNLQAIYQKMHAACAKAGRQADQVRLLAVSKSFGVAAVAAAAAAGCREFGENYAQEGAAKIAALAAAGRRELIWHFIGPLQSNKTRLVAEHFHWVQSVDRLKIAERLAAQRPAHLPPLQVCVQVNISGEAHKAGCAPQEAQALCAHIARLPQLNLRGLMAIPAAASGEAARPAFRALRELFETLRRREFVAPAQFDTLSMGMSADFEIAIEEGATLVRIGSALFGPRPVGKRAAAG